MVKFVKRDAAMHIIFLGPAGCGKSTLTATFGNWVSRHMKIKVGYVNLDAGCTVTPFKPDYDIRKMFTVKNIMKKEKLGPNGAMIRAAELMEKARDQIVNDIAKIETEYKLIDTPGQMEIFIFRPAGPKITEAVKKMGRAIAVYITDPNLATTATGLAIATSLSITIQLRLEIPTVTVLNKADTLKGEKIGRMLVDIDYLQKQITREKQGAMVDLALHYVDLMRNMTKRSRIIKVSAKTSYGMRDLYDLCREAFCACGET
jgi:translation initiation factor IF-2